ncbi:MAG: hypothetical protein NZO41_01080, partial [Candidatus Bipolaricaulota bacterium]|nr:hypothetical protein [Candidatus Bipolaricaulota bacterium]
MTPVKRWPLRALGVLIVLLVALGMVWSLFTVPAQTNHALFSPLFEVYQRIKTHFYKPENSPDARLLKGAIQGMIETLNDPYSRYLSPDEVRQFNEGFEREVLEEFGGLGMQIEVRDGRLLVVAPLYDTPAFRAGIEAGDWIIE